MTILLAIPVLVLALMLQTSIFSRITLLSGNLDLILIIVACWAMQDRVKTAWFWAVIAGLMVGFVSGLPWFISLAGYLLVVGIARLLHRRVWQAPLLASFIVIFSGTMFFHLISIMYLTIAGGSIQFIRSFSYVILPSILLNVLSVIPIHYLIRDLANWVHPLEVKA